MNLIHLLGKGGAVNCRTLLGLEAEFGKFSQALDYGHDGQLLCREIQWSEKLRSALALCGDEAIYNVSNLMPSYVASELPGLAGPPTAAK